MGVSRVGFILTFLFAGSVFASNQCASLIAELKAMQNAQKELLESFSRKNESVAAVLDQNADMLEKKMSTQRALKKSDLYSLKISANAFRGHEKRELLIIERFEKASAGLLDQVQACLMQSTQEKTSAVEAR